MYIDEAIALVKKYKWNSLFMKYFNKFVVIIFIPVLILISLIFMLYKYNISSILNYNASNDYHALCTTLSSALSEASTLIEFQTSNPSVSKFVYSPSVDFSDSQTADNLKTINSLMSTFVSSGNAEEIFLYSNFNNYVYSTTNGCIHEKDFTKKALIEKILAENTNQTPHIIIIPDDNAQGVINIANVTVSHNSIHSIFVVRLNLNNLLQQQNSEIIDNIFISYDGEIVFSNKDPEEQLKLLQNEKNIIVYSESTKTTNVSGKLLTSELSYGLTFAATFSPSYYQSYNGQMLLILLLCVLLSIILPMILSCYFSMKYYRSISLIVYQIQQNLTEDTLNRNIDEINFITNNITQMSDKLKNTEEELTEKLLSLEKMKVQILQNQINPHFIFNTLNSVNLCIQNYFDEDSDIVVMLNSLADIISELLSTTSYMTTIEKEVQYSKKYLAIELIRQMNGFTVTWNVEDDVLHCIVPKMILQPIIENALMHGIYPILDESSRVFIEIGKANGNLEIIISDNGCGFDEDSLFEISQQLKKCEIPHAKHIGLLNVNFRIKTVYGNDYGVRLLPSDVGAKVAIIIPLND